MVFYFISYSYYNCYHLTATWSQCGHFGNLSSSWWCGAHCGHYHSGHHSLRVCHEKEEEKVRLSDLQCVYAYTSETRSQLEVFSEDTPRAALWYI